MSGVATVLDSSKGSGRRGDASSSNAGAAAPLCGSSFVVAARKTRNLSAPGRRPRAAGGAAPKSAPTLQALHPVWNADRRELCMGNVVLRHFRRAAENQMLLLQAFQEAGWPHEIDDPLPGGGGVEPKSRLKETVARLNRALKGMALHFGVSHRGTEAVWYLVDPAGLRTK